MTANSAAELKQAAKALEGALTEAKATYKLARSTVYIAINRASSSQEGSLRALYGELGEIGTKLIAVIKLYNTALKPLNADKLAEADAALATVENELQANTRQFTAITAPEDHRSDDEVAEPAQPSIFDGLNEEIAAARKGDRPPAYEPPTTDTPNLGCVITDEEVAAARKSRPESPTTRTMQQPPANAGGGRHRVGGHVPRRRLRDRIADRVEARQQERDRNNNR